MKSNTMQVMISSSDLATSGRFTEILKSKGLSLKRFHSIKQACDALSRDNVILIFCDSQLVDGTYEDLLAAAKKVKSETRIVVTGLDSEQFDELGYSRARHLGAFDVLRRSYGIKDLEWVVICAIRDEERVRTAASWGGTASTTALEVGQLEIRTGSMQPARVPV